MKESKKNERIKEKGVGVWNRMKVITRNLQNQRKS